MNNNIQYNQRNNEFQVYEQISDNNLYYTKGQLMTKGKLICKTATASGASVVSIN